MQVVQGFYDEGTFILEKNAPVQRGKVIVLFQQDEPKKRAKMSDEEFEKLYRKFTGGIEREVDIDAEREAYFAE